MKTLEPTKAVLRPFSKGAEALARVRRTNGSDRKLVERLRCGDETALEAIYDEHHRGLLAFCRHMLTSHEEAEDAVQHTFLRAYTHLLEDDRRIELKPWLYAIARNHSISILRRRRETASEAVEPSTIGLSEEVERREDLRDTLADLNRLPDEQRQALLLSVAGDLSHPEIAGVIGCPPPKVKSLVYRARVRLVEYREARTASCAEMRARLAALNGGALRRSLVTMHIEVCESCQAFREQGRAPAATTQRTSAQSNGNGA
jgi:RNA polymerase sigma factor (sigma-70 family)